MRLTFFCAILTALSNLLGAALQPRKISGTCPSSRKDQDKRSEDLGCTKNQTYVCLNMRGLPDDVWFEACSLRGKTERFPKGTRPIFDTSYYIDTVNCPVGRFQNTSYTLMDRDVARCPYPEKEKTVTEDSGTHAAGLIVVVVVVVGVIIVVAVIIVICCSYWRNHRGRQIKSTTENGMTSNENYYGSVPVDLSGNQSEEDKAMILQPTEGNDRTNERNGAGEADSINDLYFDGNGCTEPLKRVVEVC